MFARVLVVGGTGLVGNALCRALLGRCEVRATSRRFAGGPSCALLDVRDGPAVERAVAEFKPDLVAVPAANAHVDYCELHPEQTRLVNVDGALAVARAAARAGARVLYFSSDYVFDGERGDYREDDPVAPLNEYGRQKVEVEKGVLALDARSLVVRSAGIFGWEAESKNFVLQVVSRLRRGEPVKAAEDVSYNPTYSDNLAEVSLELAARQASGIFHVVGGETISRLEFARRAAVRFGLDASRIQAVSSLDYKHPARRPRRSSLNTDKVRALTGATLWGVSRSLDHMVESRAAWEERVRSFLPADLLDACPR